MEEGASSSSVWWTWGWIKQRILWCGSRLGTSGEAGSGALGPGLSIGSREDTWKTEAKGMLESASEAGLLHSNYKEHDVHPNPNGWGRLSHIPTRLALTWGPSWSRITLRNWGWMEKQSQRWHPGSSWIAFNLPLQPYFFLPPSLFSSFDQTGLLLLSRHPLIS